MDFQGIFWNERGRLRSGLRFMIFLLSFFLFSAPVILGLNAVMAQMPIGYTQGSLLAFIVPFGASALISLFLGWFYGKIFEDLPFRALGIWLNGNWLKDLFWGLVIGAASIGLAVLLAAAFGGLSFQPNNSAGISGVLVTLAVTLLIFVIAALSEEALFRGYLLQTLTRARLFWIGAVLTSFLFATAHNQNPGATLFSWVNTFIAGLWFAVAYWKTRNLWFPWGVHVAWNWLQGSVFGINVSGLGDLASAPFLRPIESGPVWLTGGEYGIEGGLTCTIALLASTALIYFAPFLKPTEEMLALTSEEIPRENNSKT